MAVATRFYSRSHFVEALSLSLSLHVLVVILAIITITSGGGGNNVNDNDYGIGIGGSRKLYAAAFSSSSSSSTSSISSMNSRGRYRYASSSLSMSIPASRGDDMNMNEWVSQLEEDFKRSGDGNNNNSKSSANVNTNDMEDPVVSVSSRLQQQQQQQPFKSKHIFQTPVTTHTGVLDLLNEIDNAPPNDLTVVLFFAHYCRTCHRANIPFKQLAYDFTSTDDDDTTTTTTTNNIRFVRFETSVLSPKQFRSLLGGGIDASQNRVPFLHMYRNGICVASFSATAKTKKIRTTTSISTTQQTMVLRPRLLENIAACRERSVSDWSAFRDKHDAEIEQNKAARRKLRADYGIAMVDHDNDNDNDDQNQNHDDNDDFERRYQSVRTLTSEAELLRLVHHGHDNTSIQTNNHDEEEREEEDDDDDDDDDGDHKDMVVVMFHSHFDQSCLRAQHKYRKIADERQQQEQQQRQRQQQTTSTTSSSSSPSSSSSCTMARIESSILPDTTLQLLGIQRYPHIQIYFGRGRRTRKCVASFSIPRAYLFAKMLHESLDVIDQRTPQEWTEFYKRHEDEIESNQLALEGIVHSLFEQKN